MNKLTAGVLRKMPLPAPEEGDKRARGDVLVVGGSREVPGAALLAGVAALRAGAGRLQIATCSRHATALAIAVPEAFVLGLPETDEGGIHPSSIDSLLPLIESSDAVLVGPGMADQRSIDELSNIVLDKAPPRSKFVFDARAIISVKHAHALIARHKRQLIITPHAGEMAGMLDRERSDIEADPATVALKTAKKLSITVALKGGQTFIASGRRNLVCRDGNVGLATSGSGDVLAGIITGLVARGADPFVATCWGVYLHAKAGDRLANTIGPLGFLRARSSQRYLVLWASFDDRKPRVVGR